MKKWYFSELKSKEAEVPTIEIKKTSSALNIFREYKISLHQQLVKIDTLQKTKVDFTYQKETNF